MTKAILFDSDGVLVDSERLFFEATRTAFEESGVTVYGGQWARWFLGEGRRSRDIAAMLGMAPAAIPATIQKRDEMFWSRVDQGVPLFPGVRETLDHLAAHFRLAVVTGASRQHYDRVHALNGLGGLFGAVVTSDDYEHAKPHPQAYLTALEMLGLAPDECLAVEDSPRGASAAVSAGIRCVIIPTCLTDVALCPAGCTILDNVAQLVELTASDKD
jgi:HAD superfamily hydrolase (TIGR01509 family)